VRKQSASASTCRSKNPQANAIVLSSRERFDLLLTNYFLGGAASFFLSLAVSSASVERDSARCHAARALSGFPHAA